MNKLSPKQALCQGSRSPQPGFHSLPVPWAAVVFPGSGRPNLTSLVAWALILASACLSQASAQTSFLVPKNNAQSTLSSGITSSATTATVDDGSVFPSTYPYHLVIGSAEVVRVTNRSGNDLTIVRAQESTSAQSHSSGATVRLAITAEYLSQIQDAVNTLETGHDTESELETFLTDVTDVFTNNDGSLADDDVTDDNVESMATAGGSGTAPLSDGAGGLSMLDVLEPTEIDTQAELESLLTDATDLLDTAELDSEAELESQITDVSNFLSNADTSFTTAASLQINNSVALSSQAGSSRTLDVTDKLRLNYSGTNLFATIIGPNQRDLRFDLRDNGNDSFVFRASSLDDGTVDETIAALSHTGNLQIDGDLDVDGTRLDLGTENIQSASGETNFSSALVQIKAASAVTFRAGDSVTKRNMTIDADNLDLAPDTTLDLASPDTDIYSNTSPLTLRSSSDISLDPGTGQVVLEEASAPLRFNYTMGNSTLSPTTDAPTDWVEVSIAGTTYYLPAYTAS